MLDTGRRRAQYIEPVSLARAWRPPIARLPTLCGLCRGWGWSRLCADCVRSAVTERTRCPRCALPLAAAAGECGRCLHQPPPWDAALAAVDYAAPWDALLARVKFHDALDLAEALVDRLHEAVIRAGQADPGLLLPAPLSAQRLRERGYNQAWELTHRLAHRLQAPADAGLLLRIRHTAAQMDLPLSERAANIRDAFAVEPTRRALLRGRTVTVVDDVMTTGATLGEISRVLRGAGAARVQVWAFARTPAPGD